MEIAGLLRSSFVDFPGRVAAVVFSPGCNLRCPYCHNGDLVRRGGADAPRIPLAEVLEFLLARQGRLGGVVLSGGEPTLQAGLVEFVTAVRGLGYPVKLDTNGTAPEVVEELLPQLDHVALDIKAPMEIHGQVTGVCDRWPAIEATWHLLRRSRVAYELRTTVAEPLLGGADLDGLVEQMDAGEHWFLQPFKAAPGLLRPERGLQAPSGDLLKRACARARGRGVVARVRGGGVASTGDGGRR